MILKHDITTLNTKKTLSASLKKLMQQKPFSKITVSNLISESGLNRNTFYYHFEDIYALLRWTLEQEAIEVVRQFDLMVDYKDAILFVLDYLQENNVMLKNIYDSLGRDELKRFFYNDFIGITKSVIEDIDQTQHIGAPTKFKKFLSMFYTEALSGILLEAITDKLPQDREMIISNITVMITYGIPSALKGAARGT
ncbi:MAG: TetR/AcrR family transcriptional regulator C-terminal domain-containing protein [Fusicatenibacter sp.]|nr:TetR/AcrR family transcriptional regulator C-terminal domain-containing protein [Lachnospiraceae bacterium]MDY2938018.1 TetR/AcrR family transcriptional regulator C-terminal domain-containing protein [Fusicatenibacter sp.]